MSALGKTKLKKVEYINAKGEKKKKVDGQISCSAQHYYGENDFLFVGSV